MSNEIKLNSLSTRQAAKWLLIHEKRRHQQDIAAINRDLKKLEDKVRDLLKGRP